MNSSCYVTILEPMVSKLDLKGNELMIFALVHGFTQDGVQWFSGGLSYVAKWSNVTKKSACTILNKLVKKNLLKKSERTEKGIKYCKYQSRYFEVLKEINSRLAMEKTSMGHGKNFHGAMEKTSTNIDNIDNNRDNNKESKTNVLPKKGFSLKDVDSEKLKTLKEKDALKLIDKIKQSCLSVKEDDIFIQCWKLYERKGSKAQSLKNWEKLTSEEHQAILKHIPFYNRSRPDKKHRKDFQSYINLKTFNDVVIYENRTLYDPELMKKQNSITEESSLVGYQDQFTDDTRPHLFERSDGMHWHKFLRKWTFEV